eukprot:TRINITY_DN113589_c0_g1_i1.p1 TRINITY_DN113589_c0_g1~~TRINITY_DN113589_c0_g1_i1.p1  ORF type:complete len:626 (-),score=128.39 TRINITY_DN113589_c0_g1_i1:75-1952(-)
MAPAAFSGRGQAAGSARSVRSGRDKMELGYKAPREHACDDDLEDDHSDDSTSLGNASARTDVDSDVSSIVPRDTTPFDQLPMQQLRRVRLTPLQDRHYEKMLFCHPSSASAGSRDISPRSPDELRASHQSAFCETACLLKCTKKRRSSANHGLAEGSSLGRLDDGLPTPPLQEKAMGSSAPVLSKSLCSGSLSRCSTEASLSRASSAASLVARHCSSRSSSTSKLDGRSCSARKSLDEHHIAVERFGCSQRKRSSSSGYLGGSKCAFPAIGQGTATSSRRSSRDSCHSHRGGEKLTVPEGACFRKRSPRDGEKLLRPGSACRKTSECAADKLSRSCREKLLRPASACSERPDSARPATAACARELRAQLIGICSGDGEDFTVMQIKALDAWACSLAPEAHIKETASTLFSGVLTEDDKLALAPETLAESVALLRSGKGLEVAQAACSARNRLQRCRLDGRHGDKVCHMTFLVLHLIELLIKEGHLKMAFSCVLGQALWSQRRSDALQKGEHRKIVESVLWLTAPEELNSHLEVLEAAFRKYSMVEGKRVGAFQWRTFVRPLLQVESLTGRLPSCEEAEQLFHLGFRDNWYASATVSIARFAVLLLELADLAHAHPCTVITALQGI